MRKPKTQTEDRQRQTAQQSVRQRTEKADGSA